MATQVPNSTAQASNSTAIWSLIDLSEEEDLNLDRIAIQGQLAIGRREESDLCLTCSSVSGEHAHLSDENGELLIKDLQSTNGTFVNGIRISESAKLESGDIVQFGSKVFQIADEAKPSGGRVEMQTVQSEIPESPQGRFHRLLRVGVVPFFQPVFNIAGKSPKLTGYEILGRGRLPGLCTPEEMFNAAVKMEKTAELSEALRKHGIEVADANLSSGKLLFVNTHPSEISADRLSESLARLRTCFPDRRFILEVPEAILEIPNSISVVKAATDGMNIDISIYGFRAETIRLNALARLAPKFVKFSESLIRGIGEISERKQKVISSMVKMLVELDIQPVAEMVETLKEHQTIKRLGFELAQGFHYGRPTSIEDCFDGQVDLCEDEDKNEDCAATQQPPQKVAVPNVSSGTISTDKGTQWILSQPAKNYTIQVIVTTSQRSAIAYTAKQNDPDSFVIYPKAGKRRNLFVVAYGSFDDRDAAKTAADTLKDSTCFPLIRMFENVQNEARKANP